MQLVGQSCWLLRTFTGNLPTSLLKVHVKNCPNVSGFILIPNLALHPLMLLWSIGLIVTFPLSLVKMNAHVVVLFIVSW